MQSEQHYRVSLPDAIAHYNSGDLTAKGLLHFYFKIRIKPGWTLKETQQEICDRIGIGRTAFYSALSKLKAEGSINWSAPSDTKFSISLPVRDCGHQSAIADNQSAIADNQSAIADNQSAIADNQSAIAENKSPNPLVDGDSSDSPDFFSNSFSYFSSTSLSECESECAENLRILEVGKQEVSAPSASLTDKPETDASSEQSSLRVNIPPASENDSQSHKLVDPFLARKPFNPQMRSQIKVRPGDPWTAEQLDDFRQQIYRYAKQEGLDAPHAFYRKQMQDVRDGIGNVFWDEFVQDLPLGSTTKSAQSSIRSPESRVRATKQALQSAVEKAQVVEPPIRVIEFQVPESAPIDPKPMKPTPPAPHEMSEEERRIFTEELKKINQQQRSKKASKLSEEDLF